MSADQHLDTVAAPPPAPPTDVRGGKVTRLAWLCLAVVLAADVMDLMDSSITNVAAPTIRAELGGGSTLLQWLAAAYSLAFAVLLITGGRLGDLFGRRRLFLLGMAGFTVASAACALAEDPGMLIATRAVQGAFGALLIPQGFGVIKQVFPPDQLGKAFAAFGPAMGLSAVAGPILSGALVDADLFGTGWRMIFLINVPFGIAAWLLAARVLPRTDARTDGSPASTASPNTHDRADGVPATGRDAVRAPSPGWRERIDPGGMLLITAAMAALVYPLVEGRERGWPWWIFAILTGGVALLGVFAAYERGRGHAALIEGSLLPNRAFRSGLVVALATFASITGLSLVLSLFYQAGLQFSPLRTGLTIAPIMIGVAVSSAVSFPLVAKLGRAEILLGLLVLAAGLAGFAATVHHGGLTTTSWQLVPASLVIGAGMGFIFAPLFDVILAGVSDAEVGSASGVLNAVQQFAGALGVALVATVFFDRLAGGADPAQAVIRTTWVAIGMLAVSFALTFLLPRQAREDAGH